MEALQKMHRVFDGAIGGHDDDWNLRVVFLDGVEHGLPVHLGHADVADHDVDATLLEQLQRLASVGG